MEAKSDNLLGKNGQANPENLEPLSQDKFEALFEESKKFKDEGSKEIRSNLNKALDKYIKSAKVFLKSVPQYAFLKEDFHLDWIVPLTAEHEKLIKEHLAILFSNCSYIYLEKEKPLVAHFYANFSVWCNGAFYKGSARRARAMIDLLYLYDAQEVLLDLENKPLEPQLQQEVNKMKEETQKLIQEYSAPQKVIQFLTNQIDFPFERTYKGPFKVVNIPGKGRGIVASEDIPQGTTLLIEKGIIHKGEQKGFCKHFLTELDKQEDLKFLYMNLFNHFESPEHKKLFAKDEEVEKELLKDKKKKWKYFTSEEVDNFLCKVQCYTYQVNSNPGLFAYQSLLNHSCAPNTCLWTAGDMTLTLANQDIKKGEEICTTYISLIGDQIERQELLDKYKFKCDCPRCNLTGIWKDKEPQVSGMRCPDTQTEVVCNEEKKFVGPNGWTEDHSYYTKLNEEINSKLDDLAEGAEQNDEAKFKEALELLERVEKLFGQNHYNRAYALRTIAKFYSYKKDEKMFLEYFWKVMRIIEFYPRPELRDMLTGLLYELCLNFRREPSSEELEPFKSFGLRLDVTKGLWKRSVSGGQ